MSKVQCTWSKDITPPLPVCFTHIKWSPVLQDERLFTKLSLAFSTPPLVLPSRSHSCLFSKVPFFWCSLNFTHQREKERESLKVYAEKSRPKTWKWCSRPTSQRLMTRDQAGLNNLNSPSFLYTLSFALSLTVGTPHSTQWQIH